MKKILVTTDFSRLSLHAYEYALELAHYLRAKLTLMYCYPPDNFEPQVPRSLSEALIKKDEEAALTALEGYGYAVQKQAQIEVPSVYILEPGHPVDAIVEYADFMEADMIVMGTWWAKGASGVVDTWLGSVATKVIERTDRPVLLVPEWALFAPIRHIAYATNFQEEDQRIPTELTGFTPAFDFTLSCIHASRPTSVYDPIQFAFLKEMYRLELDTLRLHFYTIQHKSVVEGLDQFVKDEAVDLLALMTHEHLTIFDRLLGPNLVQQMAFHTKIPLLVLHQEYEPIV